MNSAVKATRRGVFSVALATAATISAIAQESAPASEATAGYGEEELLLRFFLGIVFPVLILVVLRMARYGIRRWETRWRHSATLWIEGSLKNRGLADYAGVGRKIINALLGIERILVFSFLTLFISLLWFALFPQTRALAIEFASGIVEPVLRWFGKALNGLFLIAYSIAVVVFAIAANRYLSGRFRKKPTREFLTNPVLLLPLRASVWLIALFLCLFPYSGIPRFFAVGLLLIALFVVLFAMRPILEEIAIGFYLNSTFRFQKGEDWMIDGDIYTVVDRGSAHARMERNGRQYYLPYSKLMKATLAPEGPIGEANDRRA